MNSNNFENMIKKYTDELIKMSKEKTLPEEESVEEKEDIPEEAEEKGLIPFSDETESRASVNDIPGINKADFYEEVAEELLPEEDMEEMTDFAYFSARVFTGNNAYPIENAKVLVVKDDKLYTFLATDRDGMTKKIRLPAFPEANSLDPESNKKSVRYTGEVYATGFTPKKDLLISAVGGSEIVLDVQMTPVSERMN